jgi:ArsR family transcriptional regulator
MDWTRLWALGDPVRLRLLIATAETGEAYVCDLTAGFDLTGPTISHHLTVLREAGLIDCERRGTWVYYWILCPASMHLHTCSPTSTATQRSPSDLIRAVCRVWPQDIDDNLFSVYS